VEAEILDFDDPNTLEPRDVPQFARGFDLVVTEQGEPGRPPNLNDLTGAILAECGRPVIVVPGIQREPARFDRIVGAWDGSASAARALGDAAPLFERAECVEIVCANSAVAHQLVVSAGERIARRFARRGVDANFRRIPGNGDPANILLSHAADFSADMIVAGGYGHSRIREALLGGVTRTLLGSMTVHVPLSPAGAGRRKARGGGGSSVAADRGRSNSGLFAVMAGLRRASADLESHDANGPRESPPPLGAMAFTEVIPFG
jgi:nucleotide-binding universal stress UspA family protein